MVSLGWTAWMGIGGGAFICLCLSTLWVSNICVARQKRLESGGRLHANVFGVATRNPWGLSKGSGIGEVAVTIAGESSERGARASGVGDSQGWGTRRHTTVEAAEIALHLEADPDRALAASHSSPALKSRASPDREELMPMGIALPAPGNGSSSPPRSKLERLRDSFYGKSSNIEGGGGASSGPSAGGITRSVSCTPGSGGEAGAQSALERAVQSRVRSRSRLTTSAPSWDIPPLLGAPQLLGHPCLPGLHCWLGGIGARTLQERPCRSVPSRGRGRGTHPPRPQLRTHAVGFHIQAASQHQQEPKPGF